MDLDLTLVDDDVQFEAAEPPTKQLRHIGFSALYEHMTFDYFNKSSTGLSKALLPQRGWAKKGER